MKSTSKLLAAAGLAISCGSAAAQTSSWIAGDGNWSNPVKWSAGVPNSPAATAIIADPGGYTITLNINVSLANLLKLIPGPQLNMPAGTFIDLYGGSFANDGATIVNTSASNSNTAIRFHSVNHLISADPGESGELTLNAYGPNLDSAYLQSFDGITVTNDEDHTINGSGNIYARINNLGLIEADRPGRTLQLLGDPKTNGGIIAAGASAHLSLNGISLTQGPPFGVLLAEDGTVSIGGSSISGGDLNSSGAGVVQFTTSSTITDLSGNASPFINAGVQLATNGTIVLTGTTTVNTSASNSNTYINASTNTVWDDGVIQLNAYSPNLDSAYIQTSGGSLFTNNATVRGRGRIHGTFRNNGLVETGAGSTLDLASTTKTNRGLMQAVAGGSLTVTGITLANNADSIDGELRADGGNVYFFGCTISDGVMNALNSGRFVVGSSSTFTGGVMGSGPIDVNAGQLLALNQPTWNHAGTLTINPTASNSATYLRVDQPCSISNLTVNLNAYSANLDTGYIQTSGPGVATFEPSTLITGRGRIHGVAIHNGPITVTGGANTIELLSTNKTNNATAKAESSGLLRVTGITLSQGASGQLLADNASVHINSATISGGQVNAINAGRTTVIASSTFNSGVSGSGPLDVSAGQVLIVNQSAWNHTGEVLVNTSANNSATYLRFDQPCTVSNAVLHLNAYTPNLDTGYLQTSGPGVITLDSSTLVTGRGRIYGSMVNNGTIRPEPTRTIELLSTAKSNNALIEASGSGVVNINGIALTQSPSGTLRADGGVVNLISTTISGGQIVALNTGSADVYSSTLVGGASGSGPLNVVQGQNLMINQPTWTHSGVVTINPASANAGTYLRVDQNSTFNNVTIQLNRYAPNSDTAYITTNSAVGTFGPTATLAGAGRVYGIWNMGGTFAPGRDAGSRHTIDVAGSVTFQPTGVLSTDIGSASAFGQVTGAGSVSANGTLRVRLVNAFNPTPGQTFDVVSVAARAGVFADTDMDHFAEGTDRFYVSYPAGKVRLHARKCAADWNGDAFVNGDDYDAYSELFEAGDPAGDFNNDGFVNGDDYDAFASAFENGC
ncbi:MAG: GC-type dockerin domain-anchored protein [Phycisphaerales bacterium]